MSRQISGRFLIVWICIVVSVAFWIGKGHGSSTLLAQEAGKMPEKRSLSLDRGPRPHDL